MGKPNMNLKHANPSGAPLMVERKRELQTHEDSDIMLRVNPAQAVIINRLLKSGLYGGTPKQVVNRLLDEQLIKHATPPTA